MRGMGAIDSRGPRCRDAGLAIGPAGTWPGADVGSEMATNAPCNSAGLIYRNSGRLQ